jgi:hypothetical protein
VSSAAVIFAGTVIALALDRIADAIKALAEAINQSNHKDTK